MATKKESISKETRTKIVSSYMEYVLNEPSSNSVYSFCKYSKIKESDFYNHFGSIEGLKKAIWVDFYLHVEELLNNNDSFTNYTNREKLLTFYYTFFEMLSANRSYILMVFQNKKSPLDPSNQLSKLRVKVKDFGIELAGKNKTTLKFNFKPEKVIAEAVWIQLLFLLKFWIDDESANFEKTDIAIEKSVNTVFDIFDYAPVKQIVDLGKFIWNEKIKK